MVMSGSLVRSVRSVVRSSDVRMSDDDRRTALDLLDETGEHALRRDGGPVHVTASLFLFDPMLERVALVFHRKGGFWVQPGGHLEPSDVDVTAAALRELEEETGVVSEAVGDLAVVDLDHHVLVGAFGSCASHLDIGVAGVVSTVGASLVVSDESESVGWFAVDDLPHPSANGQDARVGVARERLLRR